MTAEPGHRVPGGSDGGDHLDLAVPGHEPLRPLWRLDVPRPGHRPAALFGGDGNKLRASAWRDGGLGWSQR